jgi:hypothetical protein
MPARKYSKKAAPHLHLSKLLIKMPSLCKRLSAWAAAKET